jgi:hypothetical protein
MQQTAVKPTISYSIKPQTIQIGARSMWHKKKCGIYYFAPERHKEMKDLQILEITEITELQNTH